MSGKPEPLFGGNDVRDITDADGRRLTVRQPTAIDQLRLFKAAGPILAQNQPYLGLAIVACSVIAIDDVPVPPPANEHQIESLVQKLGDVGLRAASSALDPEPNDDEMRQQAGN